MDGLLVTVLPRDFEGSEPDQEKGMVKKLQGHTQADLVDCLTSLCASSCPEVLAAWGSHPKGKENKGTPG